MLKLPDVFLGVCAHNVAAAIINMHAINSSESRIWMR